MLVCTLGDLLLDVIVRLDGPIAPTPTRTGSTRVGAGGQAANVGAWVGGARRTRPVRRQARGRRRRAGSSRRSSRARGVELAGPAVEAGGTGTVVSLATPDGARTMLSDRGVAPALRARRAARPSGSTGCDWLHVPGYSLVAEPLAGDRARRGRRSRARVSVDLSSTAAVEALGVERFRALAERLAPGVVFATEEEAELVGPIGDATTRAQARRARVRASTGARYPPRAGGRSSTRPAPATRSPPGSCSAAPELALDAAARCVAQLGAMP